MTTFATLFAQIDEATDSGDQGRYVIRQVPGQPSYLVGRSADRHPALLVRTASTDAAMPLRLAGISAQYSVPCSISDEGVEATESLSIVECLSTDPAQVGYFAACMDMTIGVLGRRPSTAGLASAVDRLVAMFQALASPPRREVTGAIGELCFILAASEPSVAVRAWHADPFERYDFVADGLRVEVKSTASAGRIHALSADQASPPTEVHALLASILVRPAGGGTTISELVDRIVRRLGRDHDSILMLQERLARAFGNSLQAALAHAFDLEQALESLAMFDLNAVPALRPPFPPEVSDVRYRLDLDDVAHVDLDRVRGELPSSATGMLPRSVER